ncbi:Uncharacterized protein APZ42_026270 [Daphnia magna]|uniref:Uncharacterized protein n=1 Tax=Daphnia magna TaxID=35525 RepID=A0A164SBV9_9CRUS|nr:Uncharacterized protein APZ42_026270 [Daphnia magna]
MMLRPKWKSKKKRRDSAIEQGGCTVGLGHCRSLYKWTSLYNSLNSFPRIAARECRRHLR